MGDGMHERGSEGHLAPPSPIAKGINFSWLLVRSKNTRNSTSTPATTSAPPSGGGPSGGPPAAS